MSAQSSRGSYTLAWYLVLTGPTIFGIYLLMIRGYHLILDGSIQVGLSLSMSAVIFIFMTTLAFLISLMAATPTATKLQREFIKTSYAHPGDLSISFFAGFLIWPAILASGKTKIASTLAFTVPTLPLQATLSTAKDQGLSEVENLFVNVVVAPPAEEMFFAAGTPVIVLGIVSLFILAGIPYLSDLLKNDWIQIGLITLIPSIMFATFHTESEIFSGFWIFAFVFSGLMKGLVYSDTHENAIPSIVIASSFGVGTHIGNNFYRAGGFFEVMTKLMAEPTLFFAASSIFVVYGILAFMRINQFIPIGSFIAGAISALRG